MTFLLLKSFHIIGVVCWFAGLFYIVRLFIYDVEASHKEEPDKTILQKQFRLMQRRLWYGITVPSMVLTVVCGLWILFLMPYLVKSPNYWMQLKLGLVVLLMVYHFYCERILKQIKAGTCKLTSHHLRVYNEIATILLCGIIFSVVLRSISAVIATSSIIILLGYVIFTIYTRVRKK